MTTTYVTHKKEEKGEREMEALSEKYPEYKKRDAVISKKARDFIAGMVKQGYNVEQMKKAIEYAEDYLNREISKLFIKEPERLYCGYGAWWEIDEDGNLK